MNDLLYGFMAFICFILGGISTYFAGVSFREKHRRMFIYDVAMVILNLIVMSLCLFVVFR